MELALCLPLLCVLVLASADIGRAYYYREAVANAGRQALRIAISSGQQPTGNSVCSASSGTASATVPDTTGDAIATIVNDAAIESSSSGTAASSVISGATVTVKWHCNSGVAITNDTNSGVTDPANSLSDAIEVKVSYPMSLFTPVPEQLVNATSLTIAVDVFGRSEY